MEQQFIADPLTDVTPKRAEVKFIADPLTDTQDKSDPNIKARWNYYGEEVTFADVQKSTKLELMANAGAYSTVKAIGTATAMSGNPLGLVVGGLAYLGTEGYAFAKSATLARDEDAFWTDYFANVREVIAEKGTMGDMLAGFSHGTSMFTGTSTPEEVKEVTDSGAFMAGDMIGMLSRDFTMMAIGSGAVKALGSAVSKARGGVDIARAAVTEAEVALAANKGAATSLKVLATAQKQLGIAEMGLTTAMQTATQTGANMGMVAGTSIANFLNTTVDSYAYDGGVINALRNGMAHGAATGMTGHFFLNHFGNAMKKVMPKLLDTTVGASLKNGIEFSAWGLSEEVTRTLAVKGMGGERDFNIDPITYGAMFGLGAAGSAIFRSNKGSKMLKEVADEVFEGMTYHGVKISDTARKMGDSLEKKANKLIDKNQLDETSELITKKIMDNFYDKSYGESSSVMRLLGAKKPQKTKSVPESMMGLMESYSLKSPQEIRVLSDIVLSEGKTTAKNYQEILVERMTNDSRYVNMSEDDLSRIVKMIMGRFVR